MKITRLEIKDYKQFKDLTLDLTYPKGHEKAGEPLDKICIIGQSGVGKTNLLKIIITDHNHIDNIKTTFIDKDENHFYLQGADNSYYTHNSLTNTIYLATGAWSLLLHKMENYTKDRTKYQSNLFEKLINTQYSKKDSISDMKIWEDENENILEKISDKLNETLIKFNIKLEKSTKETKEYNDLVFKDLSNGNIIKYDDLSTGTKNIISTFIPLKIYNPRDSIILIDEPENSFYPDIQRLLTDLYMEVGENNQLIMATHSPLIASSFEPWEVVELKFNRDNQIYRELYYDDKVDERHIDNYTLDPRMLTWTGILTRIFDLQEDSNFSFREERLMEYATLKAQIKVIKNKEEKIEKVKTLKKLSRLLGLGNNETNI
ncbi:MAG: AAA family ATPase [Sulfurovum sp.]